MATLKLGIDATAVQRGEAQFVQAVARIRSAASQAVESIREIDSTMDATREAVSRGGDTMKDTAQDAKILDQAFDAMEDTNKRLQRELRQTAAATAAVGPAATRTKAAMAGLTATMTRVRTVGSSLRRGLFSLRGALLGLGAGLAARELVQNADTMTLLTARTKQAIPATENVADAMKTVFDVAQETRVGLEATSTLFTRMARGTKDLGVSMDQLVSVTRTVNQTIAISGATAQESNAALIQFSQGLASGTLRGDELRSVLEQLPALARSIADGIEGIEFGDLRERAQEGAITTEVIFQALLSQAQAVQSQFEGMPRTVGQAFVQLQNSFLFSFSTMNSATDDLIAAIDDLRALVNSGEFQKALAGLIKFFNFLIQNRTAILNVLVGLTGFFLGASIGGVLGPIGAIAGAIIGLVGSVTALNVAFGDLGKVSLGGLKTELNDITQEMTDLIRKRAEFNDQSVITGSPLGIGISGGLAQGQLDQEIRQREERALELGEQIRAEQARLDGIKGDLGLRAPGPTTIGDGSDEDEIKRLEKAAQALILQTDATTALFAAQSELSKIGPLIAGQLDAIGVEGDTAALAADILATAIRNLDEAFAQLEIQGFADPLRDAANAVIDAVEPQRALNRELRALEALTPAIARALGGGPGSLEGALEIVSERSNELQKEFEELQKAGSGLAEAQKEIGEAVAGSLEEALTRLEGLRDIMEGLLRDIVRIITRLAVTKPLENFFSTGEFFPKGGGGLNIGKTLLSSAFSAFGGGGGIPAGASSATTSGAAFGGAEAFLNFGKAEGGPTEIGQSFIVGERGPELFLSRSAGQIVPNNKLTNDNSKKTEINQNNFITVEDRSPLGRDRSKVSKFDQAVQVRDGLTAALGEF